MISLTEKPLTGEPDAGDPPVRFGGRGGVIRHPYPIPAMNDWNLQWLRQTCNPTGLVRAELWDHRRDGLNHWSPATQ